MRDLEDVPTVVKDYLENGPFEVCMVALRQTGSVLMICTPDS